MASKIVGFSTILPANNASSEFLLPARTAKSIVKTDAKPLVHEVEESEEFKFHKEQQKESIAHFKKLFPNGVEIEEFQVLSTK